MSTQIVDNIGISWVDLSSVITLVDNTEYIIQNAQKLRQKLKINLNNL